MDEQNWENTPYVALDSETTGFSRSDRIVEVGLVLARGGEVEFRFHSYVDPGIPIPEESTAVHGITDATVRGAPKMSDITGEIFSVLDHGPWVSHNLRFDARMLKQSLSPDEYQFWPRNVPTFCSLDAAKARWGKNNRLSAVATKLGVSYEVSGLHGALADAELLARIVPYLFSGPIASGMTKISEAWL